MGSVGKGFAFSAVCELIPQHPGTHSPTAETATVTCGWLEGQGQGAEAAVLVTGAAAGFVSSPWAGAAAQIFMYHKASSFGAG